MIPTNASPVRVGIVTATDPRDRWSFSGTHRQMVSALEAEHGAVEVLGPFPGLRLQDAIGRRLNTLTMRVHNKRYDFLHSMIASWFQGRYFQREALRRGCGVLFAPAAANEIACIPAGLPVLYSPDATFRLVAGNYQRYSSLYGFSWREADRIEARAIARAQAIVVSSRWAADSVCADYGFDRGRIRFASYGPNLQHPPTREEALQRLAVDRVSEGPRILFLAVEWERKGGAIAHQAWLELLARGVNARFTVVGCSPSGLDPRAEVIPVLDKNDPIQEAKLRSIILESHFLLVPTRADCTPIAFSEAAAFGIPVITTDVGGVSSVVSDGISGAVLSFEAPASAYAEAIQSAWSDSVAYRDLVLGSRGRYEDTLNWEAWARTISECLQQIAAPQGGEAIRRA